MISAVNNILQKLFGTNYQKIKSIISTIESLDISHSYECELRLIDDVEHQCASYSNFIKYTSQDYEFEDTLIKTHKIPIPTKQIRFRSIINLNANEYLYNLASERKIKMFQFSDEKCRLTLSRESRLSKPFDNLEIDNIERRLRISYQFCNGWRLDKTLRLFRSQNITLTVDDILKPKIYDVLDLEFEYNGKWNEFKRNFFCLIETLYPTLEYNYIYNKLPQINLPTIDLGYGDADVYYMDLNLNNRCQIIQYKNSIYKLYNNTLNLLENTKSIQLNQVETILTSINTKYKQDLLYIFDAVDDILIDVLYYENMLLEDNNYTTRLVYIDKYVHQHSRFKTVQFVDKTTASCYKYKNRPFSKSVIYRINVTCFKCKILDGTILMPKPINKSLSMESAVFESPFNSYKFNFNITDDMNNKTIQLQFDNFEYKLINVDSSPPDTYENMIKIMFKFSAVTLNSNSNLKHNIDDAINKYLIEKLINKLSIKTLLYISSQTDERELSYIQTFSNTRNVILITKNMNIASKLICSYMNETINCPLIYASKLYKSEMNLTILNELFTTDDRIEFNNGKFMHALNSYKNYNPKSIDVVYYKYTRFNSLYKMIEFRKFLKNILNPNGICIMYYDKNDIEPSYKNNARTILNTSLINVTDINTLYNYKDKLELSQQIDEYCFDFKCESLPVKYYEDGEYFIIGNMKIKMSFDSSMQVTTEYLAKVNEKFAEMILYRNIFGEINLIKHDDMFEGQCKSHRIISNDQKWMLYYLLGIDTELFSSPVDFTYGNYYSYFHCVDYYFGSINYPQNVIYDNNELDKNVLIELDHIDDDILTWISKQINYNVAIATLDTLDFEFKIDNIYIKFANSYSRNDIEHILSKDKDEFNLLNDDFNITQSITPFNVKEVSDYIKTNSKFSNISSVESKFSCCECKVVKLKN